MIAARLRPSELWVGGLAFFDPSQQIGQFEAEGPHRSVRGESFQLGAKPHQLANKGLGKTLISGDLGLGQDPGFDAGTGG